MKISSSNAAIDQNINNDFKDKNYNCYGIRKKYNFSNAIKLKIISSQ